MFELISEWITSDLQELLGSYTAPTVSALVVGLGVLGMSFVFMLLYRLAASLFDK